MDHILLERLENFLLKIQCIFVILLRTFLS